MNTGWNFLARAIASADIINLLGNEYWLELSKTTPIKSPNYKPTGK